MNASCCGRRWIATVCRRALPRSRMCGLRSAGESTLKTSPSNNIFASLGGALRMRGTWKPATCPARTGRTSTPCSTISTATCAATRCTATRTRCRPKPGRSTCRRKTTPAGSWRKSGNHFGGAVRVKASCPVVPSPRAPSPITTVARRRPSRSASQASATTRGIGRRPRSYAPIDSRGMPSSAAKRPCRMPRVRRRMRISIPVIRFGDRGNAPTGVKQFQAENPHSWPYFQQNDRDTRGSP